MKKRVLISMVVLAMTMSFVGLVFGERKLEGLQRGISCRIAQKCSAELCNVGESDGTVRPMTDAEKRALGIYYARNCGMACVLDGFISGQRRLCPTMQIES